ncbi:hypothetical protein [Nonomuraea fuscirosea]|uniref:hypothetical protein n=1 Tax=Nonomuraea fuscirosea TaxID=1291556 RepID=UPI0033D1802C
MGHLPHDLPPKSAAYYYFAKWRDDGTDKTIHDLLRWHLREKKKRLSDPSLVELDTQSVRVAAGVHASTTGEDAAKTISNTPSTWSPSPPAAIARSQTKTPRSGYRSSRSAVGM